MTYSTKQIDPALDKYNRPWQLNALRVFHSDHRQCWSVCFPGDDWYSTAHNSWYRDGQFFDGTDWKPIPQMKIDRITRNAPLPKVTTKPMNDTNKAAVVQLNHLNEKHDPTQSDLHPDLLEGFSKILNYLGRNDDLTNSEKANYADTAVRAAKAFRDLTATRTEITERLNEILETGFPREDHDEGYKPGLITQGPVQVFSYCPHHLLPVEYQAYVSYIPGVDGKVLGLSKLARIAKELGRRPVLQEQLASDIADVLHALPSTAWEPGRKDTRFPGIPTQGSAVLLTGKHSCMTCRGVESDALTSVTELRGTFWKDGFEQKFHQAVASINSSTLR